MITLAISITLTILFFLAIWATEPKPKIHPYIQSLWDDLSNENKNTCKLQFPCPEKFDFFILTPEGEILKTDLTTVFLHDKKNPNGNQFAYTKVENKEVITELKKCSLIGISFETIIKENGQQVATIREADNILNARLQHLKAVESLAL